MAQVSTELGDGLIRTVMIYLVAKLTQSPLMISYIIFAQMLPVAIFGVFLGSFPDRFSKRWILVYSNVLQLLVVGCMWLSRDNAGMLLVLMVLYGLGMGLYEPARSASIPGIIGQEDIPKAVAISSSTHQAMSIIGPSVAGMLFFLNSFHIIFALIMVTYVIAAVLLYFFKILDQVEEGAAKNEESYIESIWSGIKHVYRMPALRFLLILLIPVTLAAGSLNTNINTLFLQTFQVPGEQYGFLQATVGAGAIIGALMAPNFLKRLRPGHLLVGSVIILGIIMISVIPVTSLVVKWGFIPVYVWSVAIGVFNASLNVPISSLFLQTTPRAFLGRGAALIQANVNAGTMDGILIGGWLAGLMDSPYIIAFVGLFMLMAMAAFPFLKGFKRLNEVKGEKQPDPQTIEGVVGKGVRIRKRLTDPDLLHTVFQERYYHIITLLATTSMTLQQLVQKLGEPYHEIEKDIRILVENEIVKRVETEDEKDSDVLYTFNHDQKSEFDLDQKLASQHKNLIMEGVNHIIQSGLTLLDKGLEREDEKPLYHMMLSTSIEQMTGDDWRHQHQRMAAGLKCEDNEEGSAKITDTQPEGSFFPLNQEELKQKGTYVFVTLSYRLEDVNAVHRERTKHVARKN